MKKIKALIALGILLLLATSVYAAGEAGLETGRAALAAGRSDEAITVLTQAIKSGALGVSQVAEAYYLRGLAYEQKGYLLNAEKDLAQALWRDMGNRLYLAKHQELLRRTRPGPR